MNEELTKVKEEEFSLTTLVSNEAHYKDCLADIFPLLSIYLLYPVISRACLTSQVYCFWNSSAPSGKFVFPGTMLIRVCAES